MLTSFCLSSQGRGGKGSIFVWAAGNGGMQRDHCGADGYVNSIYSIAVGAVSQTGKPAFFGEPCAGVMAVTLTGSGVGGSLPLVTVTAADAGCVARFPGTSSAAPLAAGILALCLEVKNVTNAMTRAVGVASGLVFCGGVSGVDASFVLWMVLEAGFTAPAVTPRRLGLSRLAVKWSAGPLGEATPRTLPLGEGDEGCEALEELAHRRSLPQWAVSGGAVVFAVFAGRRALKRHYVTITTLK
ncbi:Proprotein convertase subtilisin/kexin type 5 [Liparis tanakae]|uniref:Proprotein convertase subtilisin/kexin type 5 n=1 Tax=Liparis tanakae TaxID=230148 RepID=A0A4Z2FU40_9TELE|nr:Proprotein convertase subtilisin/kexin type 5 [Liparis tanakae]